jgi:hypothetical protein
MKFRKKYSDEEFFSAMLPSVQEYLKAMLPHEGIVSRYDFHTNVALAVVNYLVPNPEFPFIRNDREVFAVHQWMASNLTDNLDRNIGFPETPLPTMEIAFIDFLFKHLAELRNLLEALK